MHDQIALVAGAGGFIGGHLVRALERAGDRVRAVDIKHVDDWHFRSGTAENIVLDLRDPGACSAATRRIERVYNLASDMGGMGFIENNKALCMLSVLINTHLLLAARDNGVQRFFFSSSACVYPDRLQRDPQARALKESDAYPAAPEDGYGWEKLFGERLCRHFSEDFGLETRVARYHNVYGPEGTWNGGREKAPAAISRKVAEAVLTGRHEIEIWGDGQQTRSFTYIDDCIKGTQLLMNSDYDQPLNIGSSEMVSINHLLSIVEEFAGVKLKRIYNHSAAEGVRGRNSDNTLVEKVLGWAPSISLKSGMLQTYRWIYDQVAVAYHRAAGAAEPV